MGKTIMNQQSEEFINQIIDQIPSTDEEQIDEETDEETETENESTPEDQAAVKELIQSVMKEQLQGTVQHQPVQQQKRRQPYNRADIKPRAMIKVFTINSEQIKKFIKDKTRFFAPESNVETIITFCKRSKSSTKGYASARISFSDDVITKSSRDQSWFDRLGEQSNVRFIDSIYNHIIAKYRYDRKEIDKILNNYKLMSKMEDEFGVSEQFMNDIKCYITPKKINIPSINRSCVIFSARVEAIIEDMLSNPATGKVDGTIEIKEVYENKDTIHFTIYLHPEKSNSNINPLVKELVETSAGSKIY